MTPFSGGRLDEDAFRALVRRQVDNGVQGLVPCGTTGEAPTLTSDEQAQLVEWTLEEARGQVPVLAGIGSNSTATAVLNARRMAALGVDGVLATAPYYNKPPQAGLLEHFKAIAEAVDVEICLYDVPGRSVINIAPSTVAELAKIANVTALKDATGDMANATEVRRGCGANSRSYRAMTSPHSRSLLRVGRGSSRWRQMSCLERCVNSSMQPEAGIWRRPVV